MNTALLKKVAITLLVVLFFAPIVATLLMSVGANAETKQYDGLQMLVMGIYNLPFIIASSVSIFISRSLQRKSKESLATISLSISILSSIIGSILMLTW
jgi:hypothetical protein